MDMREVKRNRLSHLRVKSARGAPGGSRRSPTDLSAAGSVADRVIPVAPEEIPVETTLPVAPEAPAGRAPACPRGDDGGDVPEGLSLPGPVPAPDVPEIFP